MARIVLFVGRFGSGKTEISVNYAVHLRRSVETVRLVDLDVVTPYYRSRDEGEALERLGVKLVSPTTYGRFSEPVALSPAILGAFQRPDGYTVVDVGGDPAGARVLGIYAQALRPVEHDLLLVVNPYRPATASPEGIVAAAAAIESASGLRVSGLVSNPNLMDETTAELVLEGHAVVALAAAELDRPVRLLCVEETLATVQSIGALRLPVLALSRRFRPLWEMQIQGSGPYALAREERGRNSG